MSQTQKLTNHDDFSISEAESYLKKLFPKVSRTFALTVPMLPLPLRGIVMNAYLLARSLDTIEDDVALSLEQKFYYGQRLVDIIVNKENVKSFATELSSKLSSQTKQSEHDLIYNLPFVLKIHLSFSDVQQKAIERCLQIMWNGMQNFLKRRSLNGLETINDVYDYCYHAAGVVGEMLSELFSDYSTEIAKNNEKMKELSISFGRGLQITNFLYDHWEDRQDNLCWLPRDIYKSEMTYLKPEDYDESYEKAQTKMVNIAYENLKGALEYTLLIPDTEPGIRRFCFWTIALSEFALQRIQNKPNFSKNEEIKVPKFWVLKMILVTRVFGVKDKVLKDFFNSHSPQLS